MIEAVLPDGRRSVAAGVILELERGVASIATARHAVDGGFPGLATSEADAPIELAVVGRDDARLPLAVEWRAPHGIDLAIVSAPLTDGALRAAPCDRNVAPHAGDEVFAVGNPGSVASRHVAGILTHVRDQQKGGYEFQMLQSNAALTPGYSGGGLYDAHGRLIGINAMGGLPLGDQRFPNGVGLAITLRTLLELAPSRIRCDFGNANG
ncbi:serine protease [Candidatus Binatia bacterium]|nr:serine protease [Candidatus Binatia bacterium]